MANRRCCPAKRGRSRRERATIGHTEPRNEGTPTTMFSRGGSNVEAMVRMRGLEPPRGCPHSDLNAACIPISPHPLAPPTLAAGRRSTYRRGSHDRLLEPSVRARLRPLDRHSSVVVGGIGPGWRTVPLVPCLRRVSPLSSRGLGRRPLTAETGVRIPVAVLTERPYHGRSRPSGSRQPCSPVGSGRTFEPIPAFADSYAAERARSARQGSLGALLVLDCDRFKALNDRHGHVAGDLALCRLAEVVRAYIREGDTAARLGGDEFAVLLSAPDAAQPP